MLNTLRTYSPKEVNLIVFGYNITGYSDGTFVEFQRNEDNSSSTVGADGRVGLAYNANKTGTCTVTLQQNSEANAFLSAIQNQQDVGGKLIRGPLVCTDPSGAQITVGINAHIMGTPTVGLGKELTDRTWTFMIERLDFVSKSDLSTLGTAAAANIASKVADAIKVSDGIDNGNVPGIE